MVPRQTFPVVRRHFLSQLLNQVYHQDIYTNLNFMAQFIHVGVGLTLNSHS
jgi:hypothetical protein